jgi:DNA replication and repair protein RecF
MWITHGQFRHFRNYESLTLDWVPQKNLIIGENASGKTNILEAIYCLSHGKSPRTRLDRELIQWNQPFATLQFTAKSHLHGGDISLEAQWVLSPERNTLKTQFKFNGHPVKSRSEIVGKIPTVTFFLSDLLMLRGTPEDRRSALDSALVQFDPVHFKRLHAYNRVRQQKSQLLKQLPHQQDPDLLESLNQQLVTTGAELMLNRLSYLQQIETFAEVRYLELAHGAERLAFQYVPSFHQPLENFSLESLQQWLQDAINQAQPEERRRGQVLIGPHRDDIRFLLDQHDASQYGSQGQQRSIVLAIKLAEIQLLSQRLQGETPVLLLDDVMAELDPARQKQLLMHLDPAMQVFLTTTHLDSGLEWFLQGGESLRIFTVSHGRILENEIPATLERDHVETYTTE